MFSRAQARHTMCDDVRWHIPYIVIHHTHTHTHTRSLFTLYFLYIHIKSMYQIKEEKSGRDFCRSVGYPGPLVKRRLLDRCGLLFRHYPIKQFPPSTRETRKYQTRKAWTTVSLGLPTPSTVIKWPPLASTH